MESKIETLFAEILGVKPVYTIEKTSSFAEILPFLFLKFLKLFGDETSLQWVQSSTFSKSVIFRLDPQKTYGVDGWFTIENLSNKIWFCIKFFPDKDYPQKVKEDSSVFFLVIQSGYWKKGSERGIALTNEELLSVGVPNIKYSVRESLGMITEEISAFMDIKLFLLEKIMKIEVLPYASWVKEKQEVSTVNSSVSM